VDSRLDACKDIIKQMGWFLGDSVDSRRRQKKQMNSSDLSFWGIVWTAG